MLQQRHLIVAKFRIRQADVLSGFAEVIIAKLFPDGGLTNQLRSHATTESIDVVERPATTLTDQHMRPLCLVLSNSPAADSG